MMLYYMDKQFRYRFYRNLSVSPDTRSVPNVGLKAFSAFRFFPKKNLFCTVRGFFALNFNSFVHVLFSNNRTPKCPFFSLI